METHPGCCDQIHHYVANKRSPGQLKGYYYGHSSNNHSSHEDASACKMTT